MQDANGREGGVETCPSLSTSSSFSTLSGEPSCDPPAPWRGDAPWCRHGAKAGTPGGTRLGLERDRPGPAPACSPREERSRPSLPFASCARSPSGGGTCSTSGRQPRAATTVCAAAASLSLPPSLSPPAPSSPRQGEGGSGTCPEGPAHFREPIAAFVCSLPGATCAHPPFRTLVHDCPS